MPEVRERTREEVLVERIAERINRTSGEIFAFFSEVVDPDKADDLKTCVFRCVQDCVHRVLADLKKHRRSNLDEVVD